MSSSSFVALSLNIIFGLLLTSENNKYLSFKFNNINQNYITDLKSTVRTHSSKENINLKESLRLSKLKKNQKKSAAHIIINNLKINKDKERR